jgi:hypothetical protein
MEESKAVVVIYERRRVGKIAANGGNLVKVKAFTTSPQVKNRGRYEHY